MNPIDTLRVYTCLEKEINARLKKARIDAEDYFAEKEREGFVSLGSTVFGDAGGEFKRGKTKAKETVRYENADWDKFNGWLEANSAEVQNYVFQKYGPFCEWWIEKTGEVPDGIERKIDKVPPVKTGPKLYGADHDEVLATLMSRGGLLEGANRLLLGDGDD